MMAIYADHEIAIRRLIEWPDTDLPVDDGYFNSTDGDNLAQIALACRLRGELEAKVAQIVAKLRASKRKRAIVFWEAAAAILDKKPGEFVSALKEIVHALFQRGTRTGPSLETAHRRVNSLAFGPQIGN